MGGRSVLAWSLAALLAAAGGAAEAATGEEPVVEQTPPGEKGGDRTWPGTYEPQGMISVAYAHAGDSTGPDTRGLRLGYGFFGRPSNDYPWGEFWVSYRRNTDFNLTAAGLSVTHASLTFRRLGVGTLVDVGMVRRRSGDRAALAGMIGLGAEGVVRVSRWWDGVLAVEAVYRTTGNSEVQARVGIRFHHSRLPAPPDGP